jgi:hypothetical protein
MIELLAWENSGIWPIVGNLAVFILGGVAEILFIKKYLPELLNSGDDKYRYA